MLFWIRDCMRRVISYSRRLDSRYEIKALNAALIFKYDAEDHSFRVI